MPADIAVVGFDDIRLASLVKPALTTMRVPRHTLGEMVMDLLFRVMAANGSYEERLQVDLELIVRDSCGRRSLAETMGQDTSAKLEVAS